jgi:threonine synthase
VVILYPSGKVSPVQEKQLTTLGKNIQALEVKGTFDDCQQLVKKAFADEAINKRRFLTSANSINVARWLPQQFYYFFAYKQWSDKKNPPVIAVPSGNFGNICAGILAQQSGLPVKHFIAACNVNDVVSDFLQTKILKQKQAVPTLSNAMDVGDPSNFIRILEIFHHHFRELKANLTSYCINDEETLTTIKEVYRQYNYLLDPHGAVGYLSLKEYLNHHHGQKGIFLETAHPVKFPEAVEKAAGPIIEVSSSLANLMQKEKQSILLENDFDQLKEYLLQ